MLHYLNFISRKIVVNIIIELKSNRNSELREHTKFQLKKLTIEKKTKELTIKDHYSSINHMSIRL